MEISGVDLYVLPFMLTDCLPFRNTGQGVSGEERTMMRSGEEIMLVMVGEQDRNQL